VKRWRVFAIISDQSTSEICSGKAPGAMTKTYMIVELALMPPMFAIWAPPRAIQQAAVQPGGIATELDPEAIGATTAEVILPGFSYVSLNSTVCNSGQHSRTWSRMMDSA
jgi:hypothetical protein